MFQESMKIEYLGFPCWILDVHDVCGRNVKPRKKVGMVLQEFTKPISENRCSISTQRKELHGHVGGWLIPTVKLERLD